MGSFLCRCSSQTRFAGTLFNSQEIVGRKTSAPDTEHTVSGLPHGPWSMGVGGAGIRDRAVAEMLNLRLVFLSRA